MSMQPNIQSKIGRPTCQNLATQPQQQSATFNKSFWTKKSTNNPDEGFTFERQLRVATFLTLKPGQELACEIDQAGKFDDLVVHVDNDGLYLRQVKHKQSKSFLIKEENLFVNSNDMFFLQKYLCSFWDIYNHFITTKQNVSTLKEITLTTNAGLDPSCLHYFQKEADPSDVWVPLNLQHQCERYRFEQSQANLQQIKNKLTNPPSSKKSPAKRKGLPSVPDNVIDLFLQTVIFEVSHPDIIDVETQIKEKLLSLVPLDVDDDTAKSISKLFQDKLKHFFDIKPDWANVELRGTFLYDILVWLKDTEKLGLPFNYERRELQPVLDSVGTIEFPVGVKFETIMSNFTCDALNILVSPEVSNPKVASCKVLSYFRQLDSNKIWMANVKKKKDGDDLVKIVTHSNFEIFRDSVFVVEFAQELCTSGDTSIIVTTIMNSLKNKQLLKLIFIINQSIEIAASAGIGSFQEVIDDLPWDSCFTEQGRNILLRRPLLLANGQLICLNDLGIDLINVDSLSLSELVLACDEKSQLDLLLPKYDENIKETYIRRKLKLPVTCEIRRFKRQRYLGGDLTDSELIGDSVLFEKSHQLKGVVVVDLPGMGKSTLLTHLCNEVLRDLSNIPKSSKKLVVRVNLGSFPSKTWQSTLEKEADVIQFLISYHQKIKHNTDSPRRIVALSKRILEEIFGGRSSWSIIVMLDAFDEISKDGRKFVTDLMRLLLPMAGVDRIIVMSRPDGGIHKELETLFDQSAIQFVQLDRENQIRLLVAFWLKLLRKDETKLMSLVQDDLSEQCKTFANQLVSLARHQLKDEDRAILEIPLQCILFAECFYGDLKDYLKSPSLPSTPVDYNFDVLGLFEMFFNKKFTIVLNEKELAVAIEEMNDRAREASEKRKKLYFRQAMRVSIYYMTRDKKKAEDLLGERWDANKFAERMEDMKNFGLLSHFDDEVLENDDDTLNFGLIHRTFAEYFTAKYLIAAFTEGKHFTQVADENTFEIVLDIVLRKSEYEGVRRFFTRMIEPFLPPLSDGCPFLVQQVEEMLVLQHHRPQHVSYQWPCLRRERFNDHLASTFTSNKSDIFLLFGESYFNPQKLLDNLLHFLSLAKWLMLCLKEHIVRCSSSSLVKKFSEKLLDFLKRNEYSLSVCCLVKSELLQFVTVVLYWYEHSTTMAETAAIFKSCFNHCVDEIISFANNCIYGITSIQVLSAVTSALAHKHQRLGLEEDDICTIVRRVFSNCEENCKATEFIILYEISSLNSKVTKWHWANILRGVSRGVGECSLGLNIKHENLLIKNLLEIGSPEYWDGNTSFLVLQIRWFLSIDFQVQFKTAYSYVREMMNPFLVICVDYLLLMIDEYMTDNNESEANEFRSQVIRQALRLDVRILKWLSHVPSPFWKPSPNGRPADHEMPVSKAIKLLPEAHQAAHSGDRITIKSMLLAADCHQVLLEWNNGMQCNNDSAHERYTKFEDVIKKAVSDDLIPPALYLAAVNRHSELWLEAVAYTFPNDTGYNKEQCKLYVSHCMEYALVWLNEESLAVSLLDIAVGNFTKDEFVEIFLQINRRRHKKMFETIQDRFSLMSSILVRVEWVEFSLKFLDIYVRDAQERARCLCELINTALTIDGLFCANAFLARALENDPQPGVGIHQIFYSRIGHSICNHLKRITTDSLLPSNAADFGETFLQEAKAHLRTILRIVWDNVGEYEFILFVCASEEYVFAQNREYVTASERCDHIDAALLNDVAQEFIPQKLTVSSSAEVLVNIITSIDINSQKNWLNHFVYESKVPIIDLRRNEFFKNFLIYLMNTDARCFEKLAFSFVTILDSSLDIQQRSFAVAILYNSNSSTQEVVNFLRKEMNERFQNLMKRAEILKAYEEKNEWRSKFLSNDKFDIKDLLIKCSLTLAHVKNENVEAELKNLEDYFDSDDYYITDRSQHDVFDPWTDIAMDVLKYLHNQVQIMLLYPTRENVLTKFCDYNKLQNKRDKTLLVVALTFTRAFGQLTNFSSDHQELKQLIESTRKLRPYLNFSDNLDFFDNANNNYLELVRERNYREMLDRCHNWLLLDLIENDESNSQQPFRSGSDLVAFLVNTAMRIRLII